MTHYANTYTVASYGCDPTFAFEREGVSFYGAGAAKLDCFPFSEKSFLLNCTGNHWKGKPFVKEQPDGFSLPFSGPLEPPQVVLNWPDMTAPSNAITLVFWRNLFETVVQKGLSEIVVCCVGGKGRTGTALMSFLLALTKAEEIGDNPLIFIEDQLNILREVYNYSAVEKEEQARYLISLIADIDSFTKEELKESLTYMGFVKPKTPKYSNLPPLKSKKNAKKEDDDLDWEILR